MIRKLQVQFGDEDTTLTVDADGTVTVGEETFAVDPIAPGVYRVSNGSSSWTVAVAGPADDRWVFVDGRVAQVEVAAAGQRRRTRGGHGHMAAPMPATVLKVLVEPGQSVAQGDTVLVLEAMKMELPVRAPRDGVVKDVRCAVGELVPPNVPLLELE